MFEISNNKAELQFEYTEDGETATLKYNYYRKKNIAFMHTTVPEKLKGKGVGSALAQFAFSYATQTNKMVMIYCPFVAKYMSKHPELKKQLNPEFYGG